MTKKQASPATSLIQFTHLLDAAQGDSVPCGSKRLLFGLSLPELTELVAGLGERPYRAKQLSEALYRQWISTLDELTTWPKALRDRLVAEGWQVGRPEIVQQFLSTDGTERYLVRCGDGQTVETVWMPEGDGAEIPEEDDTEPARRRATICVSSQIGCAVNCQFCLTAKLGLSRSLTAGEIAGQVVAVLRRQQVELNRSRINLVFMGMGEPLLNCDEFFKAVRILVEQVGMHEARMTVSTSGIVPGIERFAKEKIRPRLAISLNAPNNEIRSEIMPINRKWPIEVVLDAVRKIPLRNREKITFEYVLLGGVTDQPEHAEQVVKLVRRANLPIYINLIVWNPGPDVPYSQPKPEDVVRFQQTLIAAGIQAFQRRPRGRDIYAACGQLKRTVEIG
jgi:23S rRNA (adenine2503-C2)-methyltransferase